MAFRARTLSAAPNAPNAYAGHTAPARVVAGVAVRGRFAVFAGQPTAAMLDDDLCDVATLTGKPWPNSSADRNTSKGKGVRMMALRVMDGSWPSAREKALQVFAESKLADPDGTARMMLKDQGYTNVETDKVLARSKADTRNIPDLSGLAAQRANRAKGA